MASAKILILVLGPTASGKTSLAIDLAQHYQAEILSCDARQFYREMSIGTAKPTATELAAAPHHFINSLSVHDAYSAGDYERDVLVFLKDYYQQQDIAIMTGGSGLFARIVCEGVDHYPEVPATIREDLNQLYQGKGLEVLQKELKEKDPIYYEKVDLQNHQRLIRALEICRTTGQAFSSFQGKNKVQRPFFPIKIALDWDRAILYKRINQRVDQMIVEGLEREARELFSLEQLNALKTVGYQEFFDYFRGIITKQEAIELIKRNSRRYAKRQLTWLRREKELFWIKPTWTKEAIIAKLNAKIEMIQQDSKH